MVSRAAQEMLEPAHVTAIGSSPAYGATGCTPVRSGS
jgi:hypothetical protein